MRATVAIIGVALVLAGPASAEPYGPAPDSLTWREPPMFVRKVARGGGQVTIPRRVTELDVWARDSRGRPTYRLRQRRTRNGYLCFHARSRRCRATYLPGQRDVLAGSTRDGLLVYGWQS